mgnify:FL=1|jgi:hypothetical protein
MKINDLVTEAFSDTVKSDSNKVADLVRSGQPISLAVDTYRNIHSGNLDYDAAFSKASQGRSGTDEPTGSTAALSQAEIEKSIALQIAAKAEKNANSKKKIAPTVKARDLEKAKSQEVPAHFITDPKTGNLIADPKYSKNFRGNQYTGGIPGPGAGLQKVKDIIADPLGFATNPLGATDTDDAISKGANLGRKIFTPRTGITSKSKLSLR